MLSIEPVLITTCEKRVNTTTGLSKAVVDCEVADVEVNALFELVVPSSHQTYIPGLISELDTGSPSASAGLENVNTKSLPAVPDFVRTKIPFS